MKRTNWKAEYIKLFFKYQALKSKCNEAKRHINLVKRQIKSFAKSR